MNIPVTFFYTECRKARKPMSPNSLVMFCHRNQERKFLRSLAAFDEVFPGDLGETGALEQWTQGKPAQRESLWLALWKSWEAGESTCVSPKKGRAAMTVQGVMEQKHQRKEACLQSASPHALLYHMDFGNLSHYFRNLFLPSRPRM